MLIYTHYYIGKSSAQYNPQIRTKVKNSQSWDPLLNAAKTYFNYWKDIKPV